MILGVGIDLCDARRIQASHDRFGARFLDRIYTPAEQEHANAAARPNLSLAKRFAAKEAVAKALGTGVRGFFFTDIEVVSDALGKPHILLHGGAAEALRRLLPDHTTGHIHVSMSDEDPYAMAYALIECRA
ncbi:MAG TPA: holo-ACP synthase [Asticcacaulis sp.]|nr:holo-ACP synthase [Asticcacaulis sp.]